MAKGSTINWLVETVGNAHTMTRKDILAASCAAPVQTQTISTYLTTTDHLGHVEGNLNGPHWASHNRIPYFRRVQRGVYTLTEIGWARYREINKRKQSKSDYIEAWARKNGLPIVTIVTSLGSAEDFCGLPIFRKEDDTPDHYDCGLL